MGVTRVWGEGQWGLPGYRGRGNGGYQGSIRGGGGVTLSRFFPFTQYPSTTFQTPPPFHSICLHSAEFRMIMQSFITKCH